MIFRDRTLFFADTTVNINPDARDLAEIALLSADTARFFDIDPKIAMLSFCNFGSISHPDAKRVANAVDMVRQKRPELIIDRNNRLKVKVVGVEPYLNHKIQGLKNMNEAIVPGIYRPERFDDLLRIITNNQTLKF